jgi:hypothetical protein
MNLLHRVSYKSVHVLNGKVSERQSIQVPWDSVLSIFYWCFMTRILYPPAVVYGSPIVPFNFFILLIRVLDVNRKLLKWDINVNS